VEVDGAGGEFLARARLAVISTVLVVGAMIAMSLKTESIASLRPMMLANGASR